MRPPSGQTLTLAGTPAGDSSPLPEELRRRLIQSKVMKKKRKLEDASASSLELDRQVTTPLTPEGTTPSDTSLPATLTEQATAARQDSHKALSDSEEGEISEDEVLPSATSGDMDLDVDVIASPKPNVQSVEFSSTQPPAMLHQRWYEGRDPNEPARPGTLDNSSALKFYPPSGVLFLMLRSCSYRSGSRGKQITHTRPARSRDSEGGSRGCHQLNATVCCGGFC